MEIMRFQVVVEVDEAGYYVAEVPALEGCFTQGETFEEALENIKEVIHICMEKAKAKGETVSLKFPEVIAIKTLEIAV